MTKPSDPSVDQFRISRRDFLKAMLVSASASALAGCSLAGQGDDEPLAQPNIILVMTDDQPPDTIDQMPILQRELVAKGINFTHAYATTPLCCPSRASVLTGQYAHTHGVFDNRLPNGGAEIFDDSSTIATWLQAAGYRTAWMGKYLNGYDNLTPQGLVPPGWDEWHVFVDSSRPHRYYLNYDMSENGKVVHYGTEDRDYSVDVMTKKATTFIRDTQKMKQPFFLVMGFYNPHQPHSFAKRHDKLFRDDAKYTANRYPNFNEEDVSDKPAWLQAQPLADAEYVTGVYQRCIRSMQSVDESIGDMLKTLEDTRQRDNTVFIFISDNGLSLGEHRLSSDKNSGYEESIRIPFVVSYPKVVKRARQDERLVANIDLAPTIIQLAGGEIPASVDGASFVPLLEGTEVAWRDALIIEHLRLAEGFGSLIPTFEGVRTLKWKYYEYETGEIELYDMENDPYEMENLGARDEQAGVIAELAARLRELKQKQ